jgi:hypothetical protein
LILEIPMAKTPARKKKTSRGSKLMKAVKDHPVATAGIVGAAVVGAVVVGKALKTAGRVVTIKAAGDAAAKVTRAAKKK